MMQKPVHLTKIQQKCTLSAAKKKKQQSTLKNILAQPFPRYWPQISTDESKELFRRLAEVKTVHRNYFAGKKSDAERPTTFGLCSTLRRIKHGHSRVLILSADLKPRYVVNQIILLALARNESIDIFCVPNLELELESLVDFPCFAFAINETDCIEFHKFVFEWCRTIITERYPVPQLISSSFNARRRHCNAIESTPMDTTDDAPSTRDSSCNDGMPFSSLYLTKSNSASNQRAFIPKNAIDFKPLSFNMTSLDKIKSDFISLDSFDCDDTECQPSSSYVKPSTSTASDKVHPSNAKKTIHEQQHYQAAKIKRFVGNSEKRAADHVQLNKRQKKALNKQKQLAKSK